MDRPPPPDPRPPAPRGKKPAPRRFQQREPRGAPHHRHARLAQPPRKIREVHDVEAAEGDSIDEHDVDLGEELSAFEKAHDLAGRVPPVAPHRSAHEPLEARPGAHRTKDANPARGSMSEGSVVEAYRPQGAWRARERHRRTILSA